MKIEVIYATKTGHSKKIATAIAQELKVKATDIKMKPKIENVDLLYIVSGVYGGKSAPVLIEFVKEIDSTQVKQVSLLTSSAGKTTPQKEVREVLISNGVQVAENEFLCQGGFLFVGMGHPNAEDIKNAVDFVKQTSKLN
ncbi:MAG: flavodoxin domain-containing protein [Eubacteriales bacterium]